MKVALTESAISELEKRIRTAAKKLNAAPDKVIGKLLKIGEQEAEANILTGISADGNTDIYVDTVTVIGGGKLNMMGSDAAFQEFGYGLVGHVNRNPAQPIGYEQGQRDRWVYIDEDGQKRWSHGMEAQMPMYKASKAMRLALPGILKETVSEAIKID